MDSITVPAGSVITVNGDVSVLYPEAPTQALSTSNQSNYNPFGDWGYTSIMPDTALMSRAACLMDDGCVFIAGGASYGSPNHYSKRVDKYDPSTDEYSSLTDLPINVYNCQSGKLPSGNIITFGGYNGSSWLSSAFIYDVDLGQHVQAANMPFAVQAHASATLHDGRVVSFGGALGSSILNNVICYTESSGAWDVLARLPKPLFYASACTLSDGRVLIVGGRSSGGYSDSAYIYNPESNSYDQVANAPVAMRGAFVEVSGNRVVYSCGEVSGGGYNSKAHYYYPEFDKWITAEDTPDIRGFADSVKLDDGRVYVFGGNIADGSTQRSTAFIGG